MTPPRQTKRRRKISEPFDTKLSGEKLTNYVTFLVDEIEIALSARSDLMDDYGLIDLWHALYGQEPRNRKGPWPGSADLGSYIGTEKVDATRARLVKIIGKAEPMCVVEGRGAAAKNAPYVEETHEWCQQREEKFLLTYIKWCHQALIERMGILETYELIERSVTMEERNVLVQVDPNNVDPETGQPALLLEDGEPIPERGTDEQFIDAQEGEPQATVTVRTVEYAHRGPRHRVISGKDFLWLPAHARERSDIFGYFKRFYRTKAQLDESVKDGWYAKDAVENLGKSAGQETTAKEMRQNVTVQHTGHPATESFELWEGQVYHDFDGWGPRWHLITLSVKDKQILRLKDDTLNRCRFTLQVLFPREDGIDGMSFVGDKLYTLIEEHASERNVIADRSNLATNAPILRVTGSKWKPQLQAWGPRQVIDVDDPKEIQQAQVKDVPESAILRERNTLQAAERVSGSADIVSSGVVEGANPTATQVANSAAYSNARLEEQVTLSQEALEQLYELRHAIWVRAAEFNGGIEVDDSVATRLKDRGLEIADGLVTADMLRGTFRFKPRGSVESADPVLMQRKFQQRYSDLAVIFQMFPSLQPKAMDPALGDAALQDWADVHKPRDRAAFLRPTPQMAPPMGGGPFGAQAGPPGMPPPEALAALMGGGGGQPPMPPPPMPPPPAQGQESYQ